MSAARAMGAVTKNPMQRNTTPASLRSVNTITKPKNAHQCLATVLRLNSIADQKSIRLSIINGKVKTLVASNRWRKLMTLQRKIAREKNRALVGRELEVLVEGPSEEHDLVMTGRHRGQAPDIDGQVYLSGGEVLPGQMRRVRVTQASDYDLVGDVLDAAGVDVTRPKKRVSLKVLGSSPRAHQ